jgi:hypothetical protein
LLRLIAGLASVSFAIVAIIVFAVQLPKAADWDGYVLSMKFTHTATFWLTLVIMQLLEN